MLDGLDIIDWSSLTHADGAANDIPDLIRSLASPISEIYQRASKELFDKMWYQGTLYEVIIFVIPFLIHLLEEENIHHKKEIVLYLADLASFCLPEHFISEKDEYDEKFEGNKEIQLSNGFPFYMNEKNYRGYIQKQENLKKVIYNLINEGGSIYIKLLTSSDFQVRMSIPYLLNALGNTSDERIFLIKKYLLEEVDPRVKASFLMYLSFQEKHFIQSEYILRAMMKTEDEHPLVRVAAALSQINCLKKNTPIETVNILLQGFHTSKEMEEMYEELPWSGASNFPLIEDICTSLLLLDINYAELCIPPLLEMLVLFDKIYVSYKPKSAYTVFDVVRCLLYFTFQDKGLHINEIPFFITNTQRAVLVAILKSPLIIEWNDSLAKLMETFGLPYPWKLRLLLGIDL